MDFLYIFIPVMIVTLIIGKLIQSDVVVSYKDIPKESLSKYWIFPYQKIIEKRYKIYVLFSGLMLSAVVYYPFKDFWSNFLADNKDGENFVLFLFLFAFLQFVNLALFVGVYIEDWVYKLVFEGKYNRKQVRELKESTANLYSKNTAKENHEIMESVYYLFENILNEYFKTNHEYQFKLNDSSLLDSLYTKKVIDEKYPDLFSSVKLMTDKKEYVDSLTREEWLNLQEKFSEIATEIENSKHEYLKNYEEQQQLKIQEHEEMKKKIGEKFQEERKLLVKNIVK